MKLGKHLALFILILAGLNVMSYAQVRNCGTMDYLEQQIQENPLRQERLRTIERHAERIQHQHQRVVNGTITIPVVVHIVYKNSSENISDAQVQSQIDVLNEDFRRLNADAANTPSAFQGVAADAEIEFCLATVDPNGNATTGITRTASTRSSSFGTNDAVKFASSGGKDAWPAGDYLNFWVCDIGGGILGYAQFPGGSASTDGVVNDYRYTGRFGTAQSPFNLGRTATHEVGHWLNLRHIWGDGNCNADDFVSDTPTAGGPNYTGSPCTFPGPNSCNDGAGDQSDMFQNYMDYSDDGCMNLYTTGQKTRMRALFEPGGFRASLLNSNGCGQGTPPTCTDGIQNGDETGVDCGGSTCAPCPCNGNDLILTITLDNYPEETSWEVRNASNAVVASGGTYGSQPDGSTVVENINLSDGGYTFTIFDSYGDGICCSYGNGSYSLSDGTNTIASGGGFGSSESTSFCTSGSGPTCTDGVQNGNETGVDCGGPDCPACPTCTDGTQNGNETGVDCGGPDCPACPTCTDGTQNGNETGVDCGGPDCPACPTCTDGVQNGNETGVDCGGPDCPPCSSGCQQNSVTLTIVLDNYPEETRWEITDASNVSIAAGGSYNGQPDGSTVVENLCLADGCYNFIIYDAYGDGICCSYGNGSYFLNDDTNGSTLASGGSFGASETTNFCVGSTAGPTCTDGVQNGNETGVDCGGPDCPACPTCTDGVQNGNETGVDCGGSCPACPTCNDGVQNGDETGVDCGGSCAPCSGGCSYVTVEDNSFEAGWGVWNDGGSDCRRSSNDAAYANGTYCVRLRDNTNSSVMTTDNLNLLGYQEVAISFSYYPRSMENNEDFWLQASTNGGGSYTTLISWARGTDFNNNQRYNETVVITGTFAANTRFRFRCDASSNADYVYIDDVLIEACTNSTRQGDVVLDAFTTKENEGDAGQRENTAQVAPESYMKLFPNPVREELTVIFHQQQAGQAQLMVTNLAGQRLYRQAITTDAGRQEATIDASQMAPGVYVIHLLSEGQVLTKKFVVAR